MWSSIFRRLVELRRSVRTGLDRVKQCTPSFCHNVTKISHIDQYWEFFHWHTLQKITSKVITWRGSIATRLTCKWPFCFVGNFSPKTHWKRPQYTVSQKTSPFLFLWYRCQISSDSANFWQKHTPGNLKQTHVHAQFISRFICSYCTV